MRQTWAPSLGAVYLGNRRTRFRVWAPLAQKVDVHLLAPDNRIVALAPEEWGYFAGVIDGVEPGSLYVYRLDGQKERPDPASRFQPEGVHGPSQVVSRHYEWNEGCWFGLPLQEYVVYELHVGTFTARGTFGAIVPHLDELKELGVTAIELMPVSQFPGPRNWGYDGVFPFAVQNSYGRPEGLKGLVNACHQRGLAVILDVVYNHLGPEGNYLWDYGPYFTDRYKTPWGSAVNFDGPHSDHVRRYFIENALYWLTEFHVDALRLDATHAILDFSAGTFLEELAAVVEQQREQLDRRVYLIAESDRNDARLIRLPELGGYGLDAQWSDDFHHVLHTLLTGESIGYYQDYVGPDSRPRVEYLAKVYKEGYLYTGQYSRFRQHRHGTSPAGVPASRFVVCTQNHDQVGNRMLGERLSQLVSFEDLKLAAGVLLLSPFVPLIFMGEEYGETAPFLYFVSHSDPQLVEAVRRGRRQEFAAFHTKGEPPDPQAEETFVRSRLNHQLRHKGGHAVLRRLYGELLRIRREHPALATLSKEQMEVISYEKEKVLYVHRWARGGDAVSVFNFGDQLVPLNLPIPPGEWEQRVASAEFRTDQDEALQPGAQPSKHISEGEVALELPAKAFVLLTSERHG